MTPAFKPLTQGTNARTSFLGSSVATYYTVPSSPDNAITRVTGVILANTDTSARTVRVHNVDDGASAAASNAILYDVSVAANTTLALCFGDGVWIMTKNMTVQALADSANKVTITLCGDEVTP